MKIPKPIQERRRSVRVFSELPFLIGHGDFDFQTKTVNLSSHGAMCEIEGDIPLMTRVKIAVKLPKKQIRLKGVVVRRERDELTGKTEIAVFFSDIKPEDQKLLDEHIRQKLDA